MKTLYRILTAATLSPAGFLAWCALITVVFAVAHLLGWREATTILTGTVPRDASPEIATIEAIYYMAGYFGAVVVAPIFLLASGIGCLLQR